MSTALDAATWGFGAGCDVQLSDRWVLGAFGDISWTNKGQQFSIPTWAGTVVGDTDIDHVITLGGRLGFIFSQKWMAYALAGYTWVDGNTVTSYGELKDAFGDRGGWTFGFGTEAFIAEHWTLGLEYRFTRLDGGQLNWAEAPSAVADVDSDLHRVIARLSYHF